MFSVGLVLGALAAGGGAWAAINRPELYTSTPAQLSGNAAINIRPDSTDGPVALGHMFLTHNWNPTGGTGKYWNHPLAFSSMRGFSIVNMDNAAMEGGVSFNTFFYLDGAAGTLHHTVVAPQGNVSYIDNATLNGNPGALIQVTADGRGGLSSHHVGVWYNGLVRKWAIFNEDRAAMAPKLRFSVLVGSSADTRVITCTDAQRSANSCYIPQLPGNTMEQNMKLLVTQLYGSPGVYNNHAVGVWFDSSRRQWAIYNEDKASMPAGASFLVTYFPGELTPS